MDPSPNNMSFRRRNHIGGRRIEALEQLKVSNDEENNDEDQLVDNVRDHDIGEDDDNVYEISTGNEEQMEIFEHKLEVEEQEEVPVRSTASQLDDDELEDENATKENRD